MDWEFEISRCKLIYRMDKQQGSDIYMCIYMCVYTHTHRELQYSVINHNGKKYGKKNLTEWGLPR